LPAEAYRIRDTAHSMPANHTRTSGTSLV
jgi:hypothetical protein